MPKFIVTGSEGQLGRCLRDLIPEAQDAEMISLDLPGFDVTQPEAVREILGSSPVDALVNCAASTAVDDAEEDQETAFMVNGEAVGKVAAICKEAGIPMVHVSTDYVFDGSATEPYR